jgi:hypothetical protein
LLLLDVLKMMDLGNSVAEFDDSLEAYFVETDSFRQLVEDRVDIVAGDKGTGKTALFRILEKRYTEIGPLGEVEIVPAFNPTGSPIFQRLTEGDALDEGQYSTLWKAYILSLAGNWLLNVYDEADYTPRMIELRDLLKKTDLFSADDAPGTIFAAIVNLFRRLMNPKTVQTQFTVTAEGIPVVVPRVEFEDPSAPNPRPVVIHHDDALGILNGALEDLGFSLWLTLDRLDEAFAGMPQAEIPALRALLRSYLDLVPFRNVRLKLFVRRDLFRRVIGTGFVNLTHVNARKVEITWDEDSLRDLLYRRLRESRSLMATIGATPDDDAATLVAKVFPDQVDPGDRKPNTWTWIMGRIRDGNYVRPPRNLIDLVKMAQDAQIKIEERTRTEYTPGERLLSPDSFKRPLQALSKQRVEDTLLAEAGAQAPLIENFRRGKSEHNQVSLAAVLGDDSDLPAKTKFLQDIGFLEPIGHNFKVPMLYRDGLSITQGKAFSRDEQLDEGEVDEDD